MRLYTTLILFLICFSGSIYSQKLPSRNLTINDGLPSNSIRCIYKDSRGLLWIGTDGGLCSYDGSNFTNYNETNSLNHNRVWSICEDTDHNLWLSLYGDGIAKYDGKKFKYYNEKDGLLSNNVRKLIYSDKFKCVIMATEQGLCLFDGKTFKSFTKKDQKYKFQITGVDLYNNDYLVTASRHGIYKLTIKENISQSKLDSITYTQVTYSSIVNGNNYYAGDAEHNLIIGDLKNNIFNYMHCPIAWDFAKDRETLYIATCNVTSPEGGLYQLKNNKLQNISIRAGITTPNLWCLFLDNTSSTLWVGSNDKGLYKIDISNNVLFYDSKYFGLTELQIQTLCKDKGGITWIGAKDYIIKLNPDFSFQTLDKSLLWGKLKLYLKQKGLNPYVDTVFMQYKINDGFTTFNIIEDKDHNIWTSTTWGLLCLNNKLEVISFYGSDGGHVGFNNNDELFYGHNYSDIHLRRNKFDSKNFKKFSIKDVSTPRDIGKIVNIDNQLWFSSTTKGLYNWSNGKFHLVNANGSFNENCITSLVKDSNDNLVIGTNNGKVYFATPFNDSIHVFKIYHPDKPIIGSTINFVELNSNYVFIGTNKGINVLKNDSLKYLINRENGIIDYQFNDCVTGRRGNIIIATNDGIIVFNRNNSLINGTSNPIYFREIKVNGEKYHQLDSLFEWQQYNIKSLKLSHNQSEIEIIIGNNNPSYAEQNQYRYKVVGLFDNWAELKNTSSIHLRALQPNNYTVIVEGKNLSTGEILAPLIIDLVVKPPFYKTWWFISMMVLTLVFLLFTIYTIRVRAIKTREKEKAVLLNKLLETRLEALRAQMNPHFTFNAINSIQNYIIDNNAKEALHYLSEFSKLIRQTLDNASEKLMPLQTEIMFLNSYITVQQMRFQNIKTSVIVDRNIDKFATLIPPLIIQPFIENAFEHAFIGTNNKVDEIKITFEIINEMLVCNITDNGKGYDVNDKHSLHKSKGIALTEERLSLLNREYVTNKFALTISNLGESSKVGVATEIKITMPVITISTNVAFGQV